MLQLLASFEQTAFSTGVREIWWVFPLILVLHSLSMGLMAGVGIATGLRHLGFAPKVPMTMLGKFLPLLWLGLLVASLSGLLLLSGYPAKALSNPLFFIKLALLGIALALSRKLMLANRGQAKWVTLLSLLLWLAIIFAGRFLAYTHSILLASWLVPA